MAVKHAHMLQRGKGKKLTRTTLCLFPGMTHIPVCETARSSRGATSDEAEGRLEGGIHFHQLPSLSPSTVCHITVLTIPQLFTNFSSPFPLRDHHPWKPFRISSPF